VRTTVDSRGRRIYEFGRVSSVVGAGNSGLALAHLYAAQVHIPSYVRFHPFSAFRAPFRKDNWYDSIVLDNIMDSTVYQIGDEPSVTMARTSSDCPRTPRVRGRTPKVQRLHLYETNIVIPVDMFTIVRERVAKVPRRFGLKPCPLMTYVVNYKVNTPKFIVSSDVPPSFQGSFSAHGLRTVQGTAWTTAAYGALRCSYDKVVFKETQRSPALRYSVCYGEGILCFGI
jgi:hypothetical protein